MFSKIFPKWLNEAAEPTQVLYCCIDYNILSAGGKIVCSIFANYVFPFFLYGFRSAGSQEARFAKHHSLSLN